MRRAVLVFLVLLVLMGAVGCAAPAPASLPSVRAPERSGRARPLEAGEGSQASVGEALRDDDTDPGETIDDGVESASVADGETRAHPLDGISQAELEDKLLRDPSALGSISWGQPGAGALVNGVPMPAGPHHQLTDPAHAWGTQETVDGLLHCLGVVAERYPGGVPPYVGHLSARQGGPLNPHVSHQSGRDADVGYYLTTSGHQFARVTPATLDLKRTWAFVRALVTDTDVELILIDQGLQRALRDYARSQGEDADWLAAVFDGVPGRLRPLILHARGHATHLHVRFASPVARETARRVGPLLARHRLVSEPRRIVTHLARSGDTLAFLARRYSTTVESIMQVNGLRSTHIRAGKVYRIPARLGSTRSPGGKPNPAPGHVRSQMPTHMVVEKRRLPPPG
jgi:murein endopeptidase